MGNDSMAGKRLDKDIFNYKISIMPYFLYSEKTWSGYDFYIKQKSLYGIIYDLIIIYSCGSLTGSLSFSLLTLIIIILFSNYSIVLKKTMALFKDTTVKFIAGTVIIGYITAIPMLPYYTLNSSTSVSLYPITIFFSTFIIISGYYLFIKKKNIIIKSAYFIFLTENVSLSLYRLCIDRNPISIPEIYSYVLYDNFKLKTENNLIFIRDLIHNNFNFNQSVYICCIIMFFILILYLLNKKLTKETSN